MTDTYQVLYTYSTTDGNYYAVVSVGYGTGDVQTIQINNGNIINQTNQP